MGIPHGGQSHLTSMARCTELSAIRGYHALTPWRGTSIGLLRPWCSTIQIFGLLRESFCITRSFLACVFPRGGNGSRITTERPYNPELYYSVLFPLRRRLIGLLRRKGRIARNFTIAFTPSMGMFIGPYSPQFTICAYPMKGNASRALTAMVPYTPRVLILCDYPWRES